MKPAVRTIWIAPLVVALAGLEAMLVATGGDGWPLALAGSRWQGWSPAWRAPAAQALLAAAAIAPDPAARHGPR